MKKTLLAVSVVVGLGLGFTVFAEKAPATAALTVAKTEAVVAEKQGVKIGVVNVNKIFVESPQVAAAKADFEKNFKGRDKEINDLQKAFQKEVEEFSKNSPTMKPDAQKAAQEKLVKKQKEIQEKQAKFQNDANAAQEEALKKFSKKMEDAVNKVAKDKGLDLVVAKASLAYSKPELEVTDDILKEMKK